MNKRIIGMAAIILGLLAIPFTATQLSDEVNWDATDFIIMGTVLAFIAIAYELAVRKSEKITYRIAFGVGLLGAFLLFWVNGAVGIIGNEGQSANLLYGATFLVGFIGSIVSRFNAAGMATTLFIAAGVQMLVPVVALLIWPPPETSWSPSVFGVFWMTAFFAMLFIVSGFLFKRAASS